MTDTRTARTIADEALAYASRGIKIFPLWHCVDGVCQCADHEECGSPGKHPRIRNGVSGASSDERRVGVWWASWPQANIGLAAGANGLAIIDVDPRHGGENNLATLAAWCERRGVDVTDTYTVRTGSGGTHFYFKQPYAGVKTVAKAFGCDGIDTRGRGGYVVAPPSVHASGGLYEVIHRRGLAPWPECLSYLMEPPPAAPAAAAAVRRPGASARGARETASQAERWAAAALDSECRHLADVAEGARNEQLNHAAYKLGRRVGAGMLHEHEVTEALYAAAAPWIGHGCTEREIRATIHSGVQAGKKLPHPGPAPRPSAS